MDNEHSSRGDSNPRPSCAQGTRSATERKIPYFPVVLVFFFVVADVVLVVDPPLVRALRIKTWICIFVPNSHFFGIVANFFPQVSLCE
jgi:hypothetical protein